MNTIQFPRPPASVEAACFPSGVVLVRMPGHTQPLMIPCEMAQAIADAVTRSPRLPAPVADPVADPAGSGPVELLDVFQREGLAE